MPVLDLQVSGPPGQGFPAGVPAVPLGDHTKLDEPVDGAGGGVSEVGFAESSSLGPLGVAPLSSGNLELEEQLEGGQRAGGAPLHSDPGVPIFSDFLVEVVGRPDVPLPRAEAGGPDAPWPGVPLLPAELGPTTIKLGGGPALRPVNVVLPGLLHPLHIFGGPEAADTPIVGAYLPFAVVHQAHPGRVPGCAEGRLQLHNGGNALGERRGLGGGQFVGLDNLPYFLHGRPVALRLVSDGS